MKLENGEFSMIDSMIEQTISVVENLEKRLHEIGEKQKIMEKKLEKIHVTKIKEKSIAICASAH
jgi:hypothetical protein